MGVQQGKDEVRTMDKYVGNQGCHHHHHLDHQHDHHDHLHKEICRIAEILEFVI